MAQHNRDSGHAGSCALSSPHRSTISFHGQSDNGFCSTGETPPTRHATDAATATATAGDGEPSLVAANLTPLSRMPTHSFMWASIQAISGLHPAFSAKRQRMPRRRRRSSAGSEGGHGPGVEDETMLSMASTGSSASSDSNTGRGNNDPHFNRDAPAQSRMVTPSTLASPLLLPSSAPSVLELAEEPPLHGVTPGSPHGDRPLSIPSPGERHRRETRRGERHRRETRRAVLPPPTSVTTSSITPSAVAAPAAASATPVVDTAVPHTATASMSAQQGRGDSGSGTRQEDQHSPSQVSGCSTQQHACGWLCACCTCVRFLASAFCVCFFCFCFVFLWGRSEPRHEAGFGAP